MERRYPTQPDVDDNDQDGNNDDDDIDDLVVVVVPSWLVPSWADPPSSQSLTSAWLSVRKREVGPRPLLSTPEG